MNSTAVWRFNTAPDDDSERLIEEVLPTVWDVGFWHGETVGLRADGSTFATDHVLATTEKGELVCTVLNITDRKERKRRFEAIFNNTYTFAGLLDPDGTVLEMNEIALSFGGLDRADVVGKPFWETDCFRPIDESRETVRDAVEQARNGDLFRDEIRMQGADREAVIDFSVRPITDERGDVTLLVPEGRDITTQKQYVRRLETLIDNLPGMVYRCSNERGWPMKNVRGEVEDLTGYPPSALESRDGLYGTEIIHPDDRQEVWETVQAALDTGESFELTYRIVTDAGDVKWVWERGQEVYAETEDTAVLEGFITDITEREQIARELREEREFIDQALDTLDDLFYVVGTDGGMRRWNERVSDVTGYTDAAIAGMQAVDFFPADEQIRISEAIEEVLTTGTAVVESELLTADGDRIPYEFTGSRLTDTEGDVTGLVGVGREITQRTEHAQRRDQRTELPSEFASVISHDLRNPLRVAEGRLQLAREEHDSEHLETVGDALDRMERIIDDVLWLAREGKAIGETEPVDLQEIVETTWTIAADESDRAEIRYKVSEEHARSTIVADYDRLCQLFENLFRNAVEHAGPDVTVRVEPMETGFAVVDDGPGIPPEQRHRVFDINYSTSTDGTGIGLRIVERVAEAHGWDVLVTESETGGARFEITGIEESQ